MRLKLDENLGRVAVEMLRQADHDVTTVSEQGMRGAPDRSVIEMCRAEGRCLVTLDLEFGNPLIFRPSNYHGVAVLRLPRGATPRGLSDGVRTLIGGLQRDSIEGKLWSSSMDAYVSTKRRTKTMAKARYTAAPCINSGRP